MRWFDWRDEICQQDDPPVPKKNRPMTRLEQAHDLLHRVVGIKNRCGSPEIVKETPNLHVPMCFKVAAWLEETFPGDVKRERGDR